MKLFPATIVGLFCLTFVPNLGNAQNNCTASISLSVQGTLKGVAFVNANFVNDNASYAIRGVKPSKTKINGNIACGQYQVAATAVAAQPPSTSAKRKLAIEPAGECKLIVGSIAVGQGESSSVTFPTDFNCP